MTAAGPERSDDGQTDVDAAFAAIIAGLDDVQWTHTPQQVDAAVESATAGEAGNSEGDRAAERAQRKSLRRMERAEEVAEFQAERQAQQDEIDADDAHFVPPEPPPLPRLRRRTVAALLLMALGILAMVEPQLFQIAPDAVLILGLVLLMTGIGLLVSRLRARATDPEDGSGWDDGARL